MPSMPQRDDLRIMFVVGRLFSEASGVTRIMCDLANALGRQSASVNVYAALQRDVPTGAALLQAPALFISESGYWLGGLSHSPALRKRIDADASRVDAIHCHSFWMLPNHYASLAAIRRGRGIVFSAHGALEPWALQRSGWKKKLVGAWWQWRDLRRATCIHVNSIRELPNVRGLGLTNPVAIVPNGVDVAPFDRLVNAAPLLERFPQFAEKKLALFMSRLHPKKGGAHLLEAWRALSADQKDWHLALAGADDGAEMSLRAQRAALGLESCVTFTGTVRGEEKHQLLAAADLFVQPSFSEGFSMSILEALAARLPAIITPGCNFPEATAAGAAIEVAPNAIDAQRGLRLLMEMPDAQRREMGQRGRALVERSYRWEHVALQMIDLYQWLAGNGPRPEFVVG